VLLAFGDYVLDNERRELQRGAAPIALEPQVFDLLLYLVQQRDRVVSKDDLLQAVWGGRIVSDSALAARINAARRALGDDGEAQRWIRTLPRKGVRFIGAVREEPEAAPASSLPPRLSIVVLPFTNLSDDREQQYFADGVTEDLTTDLSRIAGMFVISRNTAFTYRDKRVDTKQVGRELGVRHVLEGSVRRSGSRVRVTAQLIDAELDAHIWAERFDRDAEDPFAVQDEITSRIAVELYLNLPAAEVAKPTDHPTALDYLLRARAEMMAPPSPERSARMIGLLEQGLALDSQSVAIRGRLAGALASRVLAGMSAEAADIERARALADGALALSPRDWAAHFARGEVLRALGRWMEAAADYEACIAGNSNVAFAYAHLAECRMRSGAIDATMPLAEQALRLSPHDPEIGVLYSRVGFLHLLQSRIDEAIAWLEKAVTAAPATVPIHAVLAAAHALAGNEKRAAGELAEARRLAPDDRYSSLARLRGAGANLLAPRELGRAEDPRPHRGHLFRRPTQGRNARGIAPPVRLSRL
jgi:TolB-like protein